MLAPSVIGATVRSVMHSASLGITSKVESSNKFVRRLTVKTRTTRTAGRFRQLVGSQVAGLTLALLMVQRSAARGRQRPYAD